MGIKKSFVTSWIVLFFYYFFVYVSYPDLRNNATEIYTQEDVLMIVNYAKDRGIRVIPEVESG